MNIVFYTNQFKQETVYAMSADIYETIGFYHEAMDRKLNGVRVVWANK